MPAEGSVTLLGLNIKAVKADILQQRVTLTFSGLLDDQIADVTARLQKMKTFNADLDLTIEPQVAQLPIRTFGSESDPFQDTDA